MQLEMQRLVFDQLCQQIKENEMRVKMNGGMLPWRATPGSAGLDLFAVKDVLVRRQMILGLGISVAVPDGCVMIIKSRS